MPELYGPNSKVGFRLDIKYHHYWLSISLISFASDYNLYLVSNHFSSLYVGEMGWTMQPFGFVF